MTVTIIKFIIPVVAYNYLLYWQENYFFLSPFFFIKRAIIEFIFLSNSPLEHLNAMYIPKHFFYICNIYMPIIYFIFVLFSHLSHHVYIYYFICVSYHCLSL